MNDDAPARTAHAAVDAQAFCCIQRTVSRSGRIPDLRRRAHSRKTQAFEEGGPIIPVACAIARLAEPEGCNQMGIKRGDRRHRRHTRARRRAWLIAERTGANGRSEARDRCTARSRCTGQTRASLFRWQRLRRPRWRAVCDGRSSRNSRGTGRRTCNRAREPSRPRLP
jgi:hypothetical protein